jgi:hypothetical protein
MGGVLIWIVVVVVPLAASPLAPLQRRGGCLLCKSLEFQKRTSAGPNFYIANLSREGFSPLDSAWGCGNSSALAQSPLEKRTTLTALRTLHLAHYKFYPKSGIAANPQNTDFWFMSPCATTSTKSPCIVMQLMAHSCAKKKECCKKYKHGKRCKKCPKNSK